MTTTAKIASEVASPQVLEFSLPAMPSASLSDRIKYALNRTGLTQTELANRVGVTKGSVSNWVTGRNLSIRSEIFDQVASALNVDHTWLATGKGGPEAQTHNDLPEEIVELHDGFTRLSGDVRDFATVLMRAMTAYATHGVEAMSHTAPVNNNSEPPGTAALTRAFEVLYSDEFRDRYQALPPSIKAQIVASFCDILGDETQEGDEESYDRAVAQVGNVLQFISKTPGR